MYGVGQPGLVALRPLTPAASAVVSVFLHSSMVWEF